MPQNKPVQHAIIDSATRVIVGLTIDATHDAGQGRELVPLTEAITLDGTPKAITPAGRVRDATEQEIDASGVDPIRREAKEQKRRKDRADALNAILADPAVPESLKAYFRTVKDNG